MKYSVFREQESLVLHKQREEPEKAQLRAEAAVNEQVFFSVSLEVYSFRVYA